MRANQVTEAEVRAVPVVPGTATWNPVPHNQVIDTVETAISRQGLGIVRKRFELTQDGANVFASYRLDQSRNGSSWEIGFRNSVAKKFAVGITAGTFTIVCSNLVFTGDFLEFRRHTKGLDLDELRAIANRALLGTISRLQSLEQWQEGLKAKPLPRRDMQCLTYEALQRGAFPGGRFSRFVEAYEDEASRHGQSLYSFHGALTQTIRDQSLNQISHRSRIINDLVETYRLPAPGGAIALPPAA
ncbi:hypothetical protein [Desulfohalobium retbaense]|uniref:DUF932 domain-containing protein n=1 Tax=Desulfohalobium retbaense (strain ATCC 49708 / DSM 5692 / JCM 16813 / HR100) TaxID=485915 RepID=C8X3A3_DESRD|nr:hypothetical protein [Desulfohalobium retbaense]ACV68900.1 hypothetical protein Dret_1616 [Desulfohalobium retbaense DSM 5692]